MRCWPTEMQRARKIFFLETCVILQNFLSLLRLPSYGRHLSYES